MGSVCSDVPDLPDTIEAVVSAADDVIEGEMKEVDVEGYKVLLVRNKGEIRAFSGKCTHYGAPLAKGAFDSETGVIRCPWHGACFNADTGDIEDFPGLDSLVCFQSEEKDGQVIIRGNKRDLVRGRREQKVKDEEIDRVEESVLVVGGGAAGHTAVETLRTHGWRGRVVLVSEDQHLPYDRPKLSKSLSVKIDDVMLRGPEWYKKAEVEVKLNTKVVTLDTEQKTVTTSDGEKLFYNKLLLATGGTPRRLGVPGEELSGVTYLRNINQANFIAKEATDKHVVIIGTSFIGMEVAASLIGSAASITVIGRDMVPFQASLGEEVGRMLMNMHKENGVQFCMEEQVQEFVGDNKLEGVLLVSGRTLVCQLAIVGVGVVPNTKQFMSVAGLEMDSRGNIVVDSHMATTVTDVWAAGDIVTFPLTTYGGTRVNIGHWGLAMYLGKIAGLNMMGTEEEAVTVPFFWTVQFGKSIRYAGHGAGWDNVLIQDKEENKLVAFYCKADEVVAVATLGRDPVAAEFANLVRGGGNLTRSMAEQWAEGI